MTPDQAKAVATAKGLAKKLGRRPNGKDLWAIGITTGRRQAFQSLQALWLAAGLAVPAPYGRAGLTKAEDVKFLELWSGGATRSEIAAALGIGIQSVHYEVSDRGLTRQVGPKKPQGDTFTLRRCQSPTCGQLIKGSGPCPRCGTPGLTNAA
jgi:hypothetical protein